MEARFGLKTEGRMQVELFSQTRKSELSKFKRLANAEGFDLVAGKGEPLLNDDLIRADGRLKPDVSFAQLEVKGYIKKIKKSKK